MISISLDAEHLAQTQEIHSHIEAQSAHCMLGALGQERRVTWRIPIRSKIVLSLEIPVSCQKESGVYTWGPKSMQNNGSKPIPMAQRAIIVCGWLSKLWSVFVVLSVIHYNTMYFGSRFLLRPVIISNATHATSMPKPQTWLKDLRFGP